MDTTCQYAANCPPPPPPPLFGHGASSVTIVGHTLPMTGAQLALWVGIAAAFVALGLLIRLSERAR